MFRFKYSLLVLGLAIFASACCKKRVYCGPGALKIAFSGFTRSEVRVLEIKRFTPGDYSKALDSATFTYGGNTPVQPNKRDTLWLSDYSATNAVMDNRITWGNDWQIRMVNSGRRYTITTIGEEGHRYEVVKCGDNTSTCTNELTHFSLNDNWIQGNVTYITR